MKQKTFLLLTTVIFSVIVLLHAARIVFGWAANIGGLDVPMWPSWIALVIAAFLAYQGFRHAKTQ